MHQHPRVPPTTASSSHSPHANPTRSNSHRETASHSRNNSESAAPGDQGIYMTEAGQTSNVSRETSPEGKLDLIVQNYFYKAALMILDARTSLQQAYSARDNKPRVNRWFNTELPETDDLLESTRQWKQATALRDRPSNMIIETYIDFRDLASNQKLVIADDSGKRQDVEIAIREQTGEYVTSDAPLRKCEILLERWTCELGAPWPELDNNFPLNEVLPKVYKGSIVLYRSLFAQLKFMPAWKLFKKANKSHPGNTTPRMRWRIYDAAQRRRDAAFDALELPLAAGNEKVTETIQWDPVDSPAGQFSIRVTYRSNCDFRLDTSESLFNSQFMASDEQWFQPSLPRSSLLDAQNASKPRPADMGMAADSKDSPTRRKLNEIAQKGPAYGSMSTFHSADGRIGTSPLSALRAARELHSRSPTELVSPLASDGRPMSRSNSRPSHDAAAPMVRRPSVSIQPFKTPAYSSSLPAEQAAPPSPRMASFNRNSPLAALAEARHPNTASNVPTSPRTSPKLAEAVPVSSTAHSPRPTPSRFISSSFSHRKNRSSVGGTSSRTDDDNISSGRGSTSSSNLQPVSTSEAPASTSLQTDDENISEFLKMLDSKKELKSFRASPADYAGTSSARSGTTAALSKFQQLRDSHTALSDSLSSSQMLQRSSVSSASRQLANVPPMVAGTSASIASSPGDRISPRTPHTPAIPSRLSSNSIIEYNQAERGQRSRPHRFSAGYETVAGTDGVADGQQATASASGNAAQIAGAIPIPTSPRMYHSSYRRSSSAANHHNRGGDNYDVTDELGDILPFALRSASLGDGDEREPLSLSGLVRLQDAQMPIRTGVRSPSAVLDGQEIVGMDSLRPRPSVVVGPGQTHDEHGAATESEQVEPRSASGDSARGRRPPVRQSLSRPLGLTSFEDDEPLLFAMSEQLEASSSGVQTTPRDTAANGGVGAGNARGGRMQQRW